MARSSLHDIAFTNIVWRMAYKREVGKWVIWPNSRAIVLQHCGQCNSVGNAGGAGQYKDHGFVHKSVEVKEYFVKAYAHLVRVKS